MFRKTKIFSLALLFIISTTGLPITVNLCKMAASERNQCVMHNKLVSSGCCAHETSEQKPSISFNKYNCCETDFIYKKVEDQYLVHKTSLDFFSSQQVISHSTDFIPSIEEYFQNESFYTDSSPPFLINSDLHITNSILLI